MAIFSTVMAVFSPIMARYSTLMARFSALYILIIALSYKLLQITQILNIMNKGKQNEKWLAKLNETIEVHLNDIQLSSTHLANLMGLSQRQFYRKVKLITKTTPNKYLNEIRFQKAYEYLQSGKYETIIATSNAIGFKDPNYFARKFKERFGVSPLEV